LVVAEERELKLHKKGNANLEKKIALMGPKVIEDPFQVSANQQTTTITANMRRAANHFHSKKLNKMFIRLDHSCCMELLMQNCEHLKSREEDHQHHHLVGSTTGIIGLAATRVGWVDIPLGSGGLKLQP